MTVHQKRLKIINFTIAAVDFSCQISDWTVSAGIKTGNRMYTFCSAGEGQNTFIEETDGEPTLKLDFFSDWRSGGLSDYLWVNSMTNASFVLDHHPDVVGEHVQFSGSVQIQAPDAGGKARDTETQSCTLPIIGAVPTYLHVG